MSRYQPNYHVACRLQDRILNVIGVKPQLASHIDESVRNKKLNPAQLSSLVNAWDKLEDRKRILRMKPLPKAQDVAPKEKPRPRASFTE